MKRIILLALALSFISLYVCSCNKYEPIGQPDDAPEDTSVPYQEQVHPITVDYTIKYYDMMNDVWSEYASENTFYGEIDPNFFINKLRLTVLALTRRYAYSTVYRILYLKFFLK